VRRKIIKIKLTAKDNECEQSAIEWLDILRKEAYKKGVQYINQYMDMDMDMDMKMKMDMDIDIDIDININIDIDIGIRNKT
jgi:hypothetical protein